MTKKEFKQLHSSGQLLLVTSVFNKTLEFVKNRVIASFILKQVKQAQNSLEGVYMKLAIGVIIGMVISAVILVSLFISNATIYEDGSYTGCYGICND